MEELFSQRFVYAEIIPYKNYCNILDKEDHLIGRKQINNDFEHDSFAEANYHNDYLKLTSKSNTSRPILLKPRHKNKRTKFFHSDKDMPIMVDYGGRNITHYNPYVTTKDRHIKKHYGNPFSEIRVHTIDRSIRVRDSKVTIKVYRQTRRRDVNWIYFRKTSTIHSITIDLSTGNFTTAEITSKGSTRFRKNSFANLYTMITSSQIFDIGTRLFTIKDRPKQLVFNEMEMTFCEKKFSSAINSILGFTFPNYSKDKRVFISSFVNMFVRLKKIKVPNEFEHLLTRYYPTEKYLKKNDRKLIASILDYFGIKSKVTIKLIHTHPKIDLFVLYNLCKLFGKDFHKYVGNIDEKVMSQRDNLINQSRMVTELLTKEQIINGGSNLFINDEEKDTLLRLINSFENRKFLMDRNFVNLIMDHFKMIEKVREHDYDYSFKARDYNQLHTEHSELSKIIAAIRKGWVIEYKFNEEMVTEIEKPIDLKINLGSEENPVHGTDMVGEIKFYPYLLKREEEYIEEGNFMHHCVASYSDKDRSIIISIRNENMTDRVTCEFDCQSGLCLQARHFCNGEPPGDMVLALDELKEKVKYYARMGMLHAKEKIKVPLMINGKEIKPELPTPTLRDYLFLDAPEF